MALTKVEKAVAFLDEVKPICKDIHTKEAEKRARGENFNIFFILGIETREVYICKMLGALLSPQGGHDAGAIFLEKFRLYSKTSGNGIIDYGDEKWSRILTRCSQDHCG